MRIEEFIPSYPFINDPNFNNEIFEKKEFYELKSSQQIDPIYLNHQKIIQRFLSPYTMYDELLLFATMGTGKTLSAIAVAEESNMKILIIVKNNSLVDTFMSQILFGTGDKYKTDLSEENIPPTLLANRQWLDSVHQIQKKYTISTYETFFNTNKSLRPNQIRAKFSNRVVILDEIHSIIGANKLYEFYHSFLHTITNRKILIMTGTPMRNQANEFARVMNLILPESQQLPERMDFDKEYIDGEYIIPDKIPELQQIIQGRISYLKKFEGTVSSVYEGEPIGEIKYFHIVESLMSEFQDDVYSSVYSIETEGLRKRSEQASLFVFPNGLIGNEGLKSFTRRNKLLDTIQFTREWGEAFSGKTHQEKLAQLRIYSCKYANIIETILDAPKEKCFVFNESIMEGGSIVFAECLKLFGYMPTTTGATTIGRRYALLSTTVMDEKHFKKVIQNFNREENIDGKYIQILIGGIQISEGHTFKDISQIHIATPHWNFAVVDQAIARAIRYRSHRDPNAQVKIFLHASIPISNVPSIDLWTYKTAEVKDILIKRLERVIEESAVDCAINYDRNKITDGKNNSRECLYGDCLFRCVNVRYPYLRTAEELDYSTFNKYYVNFDMEDFQRRVMELFSTKFIMGFQEFLGYFADLDSMLLHVATIDLVENHVPIKNRFGIVNYLHIDADKIFITNKVFFRIDFTESFYNIFPVLYTNSHTDFPKALAKASYNSTQEIIQNMQQVSLEVQVDMLSSLPMDIINIYIEKAVSIFILNRSKATPLAEYIVKEGYKRWVYTIDEDTIYSTYLLNDFNVLRKWTRKNGWGGAPISEEKIILNHLKLIRGNSYGYYVRYVYNSNQKNIVILSGNARDYVQGGMNCITVKVQDLNKICLKTLGYTVKGNKETICGELFKWFNLVNLVYTM